MVFETKKRKHENKRYKRAKKKNKVKKGRSFSTGCVNTKHKFNLTRPYFTNTASYHGVLCFFITRFSKIQVDAQTHLCLITFKRNLPIKKPMKCLWINGFYILIFDSPGTHKVSLRLWFKNFIWPFVWIIQFFIERLSYLLHVINFQIHFVLLSGNVDSRSKGWGSGTV